MGEHVRWEQRGDISTIILDRPPKRNAMTLDMWQDLRAVAAACVVDGSARVVMVRGVRQGDFSAGADVGEFGAVRQGEQAAAAYSQVVDKALTAITSLPVPSIAIDVKNAGGLYVDKPVVEDGNLITSRKPDDVPVFSDAIIRALSRR